MIVLTRLVDCPKGKEGSVTKIAGYVRVENERLVGAVSATVGVSAGELTIDYQQGLVFQGAVVIASIANVAPPVTS